MTPADREAPLTPEDIGEYYLAKKRTEPVTAADRDTLLTLVQQWRARATLRAQEVEVLRVTENDRLADLLHEQQRTFERCADELTALLARLTPLDPETP